MTTNAPPSRNPADNDSLAGLMRVVTRKLLQNTDDMLPARVIAYDRTANTAQVQPLINVLTTDGQQTGRAQVAAVPVLQLGGGGFLISFPVDTGDLGWIKANDRDVSLFRQFHAASAPNTYRMHSFEDAMFIPDTMLQGVTIAAEDEANAVFQNLAGTVRLALWNALLKITAPNACITDTAGYAPRQRPARFEQHDQSGAVSSPDDRAEKRHPVAEAGMVVYDADERALSTYNGSAWS